MKKRNFVLVSLAVVMAMVCGCTEEKVVKAGNNEVVIDSKVYPLESHVMVPSDSERHYVDCYEPVGENETPSYRFIADAEANTIGTSASLPTSGENYYFMFERGMENDSQGFSAADFAEGTVSISEDDKAFTYTVDGELASGEKVSVKVYVLRSDYDAPAW